MNPKTKYNGEWIDLQELGTEGQGTELNSDDRYKLFQFSIPIGVGIKFSLGKFIVLGLEYGVRKTFTDYIDDVKSDTYIDALELSKTNGPLSAKLSNRSLDGNTFGKRGTSTTKDWYFNTAITLTIKLGKPKICAFGG
jgi:hypothetical protein